MQKLLRESKPKIIGLPASCNAIPTPPAKFNIPSQPTHALEPNSTVNFFRRHISLLWIVEVMVQDLGHLKHVHLILLENSSHRIVAADLPSVARILKLVGADMFPKSFDCLWTRELNSQHVLLM